MYKYLYFKLNKYANIANLINKYKITPNNGNCKR